MYGKKAMYKRIAVGNEKVLGGVVATGAALISTGITHV